MFILHDKAILLLLSIIKLKLVIPDRLQQYFITFLRITVQYNAIPVLTEKSEIKVSVDLHLSPH